MLDRINADIKEAMKAKEKSRLEALRYLKSMLIENKTSKKPKAEMDVVIGHCKKLKDSIETYPEGNPQREKIAEEIKHLQVYLPEQMTEEAVRDLINSIKDSQDNPNMGSIMKELTPQIKGKFDGKKANQIVREVLA
jgi:uncharacterized protein YqeY